MLHFSDSKFREASHQFPKSIFLAGPTKRSSYIPGESGNERNCTEWRNEFVKLFENQFDLFIPEPFYNKWPDYESQIEWELDHLERADYIFFWVPRSSEHPGFTTNVEFGMWFTDPKVFYGHPGWAEKVMYLDYIWRKHQPNKPILTQIKQFKDVLK